MRPFNVTSDCSRVPGMVANSYTCKTNEMRLIESSWLRSNGINIVDDTTSRETRRVVSAAQGLIVSPSKALLGTLIRLGGVLTLTAHMGLF